MTDEILEALKKDILAKRGSSTRMWVEQLKTWEEMDPWVVRDKTLMEIFNLINWYQSSRGSTK